MCKRLLTSWRGVYLTKIFPSKACHSQGKVINVAIVSEVSLKHAAMHIIKAYIIVMLLYTWTWFSHVHGLVISNVSESKNNSSNLVMTVKGAVELTK